jgi:hypothetical protein
MVLGGNSLGLLANAYLNWGSTFGSSGYGLRDNGGTLQIKNSGGAWTNIPTSGTTQWTNSGSDIYFNTGNIGIGTTTPSTKLNIVGGDFQVENARADINAIATTDHARLFLYNAGLSGGMSSFHFFKGAAGTQQGRISTVNTAGTNLSTAGADDFLIESLTASNNILFGTNALERMRITSAGNVGIGTSSPGFGGEFGITLSSSTRSVLQLARESDSIVDGAEAGRIQFYAGATTQNDIAKIIGEVRGTSENSGQLVFRTMNAGSDSEKMRITNTGVLGIGTTSQTQSSPGLTIVGNGGLYVANNGSGVSSYAQGDAMAGFILGDNSTYSGSGSGILYIKNAGNRGNVGNGSGSDLIRAEFNDAVGLVLNKNGNLGIGTTSPASKFVVDASSGSGSGVVSYVNGGAALVGVSKHTGSSGTGETLYLESAATADTTGSAMAYYNDAQAAYMMFMRPNGNIENYNNSYGGISDSRLKENIVDAQDYLSKLNQVRIRQFSFISNHLDHPNDVGVIAQELEPIFPELVNTDEQGYKSVAYSKFTPMLVKGVQQLNQKIDSIASSSAATTSLYISVGGNLGVGSTNPSSKLEIKDETSSSDVDVFRIITNVDSSSNVKFKIDSDGDIFTDGSVTIGTPADIAEAYTALETDILPGMLVSFATSSTEWSPTGIGGVSYPLAGIVKATSSQDVIGVISTNPGITLGKDIPHATPVAFMGRIPVLVTNEHGPINVGDLLTLSTSTPGYATKLTRSGTSIGRALSPYTSTSTSFSTSSILLYVDITDTTLTVTSLPGLTLATSTPTATTSILATITSAITDGISVVTDFFAVKITALYAYVDTLFAREVRAESIDTETICVGKEGDKTCITKEQLDNLLQLSPQPTSPSPTPDTPTTSTSTDQSTNENSNGTTTTPLEDTASSTDQTATSTP